LEALTAGFGAELSNDGGRAASGSLEVAPGGKTGLKSPGFTTFEGLITPLPTPGTGVVLGNGVTLLVTGGVGTF
jgi:hypothetical protein